MMMIQRYLCSNYELVADAPLFCPLSDDFFGALILAEKSNVSNEGMWLQHNTH
jgi:hypothetical protein